MAKGLKRVFAKKKNDKDRIFTINELSTLDSGNLKCQFCDANIVYVSEYVKNASEIKVAAHLRLSPNTDHDGGCDYSVCGAVSKLVDASNAIEDIPSIFELQTNGYYLFRMNVLVEAQRVAQKLFESPQEIDRIRDEFAGANYVRSERHLANYFRSAAGIAKIRALIEDAEDIYELTELVKINYQNKLISWNDFYYDETRYHVLFNRLKKAPIGHPIAVNVTVKSTAEYYERAKQFCWSFQCYAQKEMIKEAERVFVPRLQIARKTDANNISQGNIYLVVGSAWATKITTETIFRNFNIAIYNSAQFRKEQE